jgi:hypothetical protein
MLVALNCRAAGGTQEVPLLLERFIETRVALPQGCPRACNFLEVSWPFRVGAAIKISCHCSDLRTDQKTLIAGGPPSPGGKKRPHREAKRSLSRRLTGSPQAVP